MIKKRTILLFLVILITTFLHAQWNYNSLENTPLDTGINKTSSNPSITSDGYGGYYIVWMKRKSGIYGTDIYAQHIDINGIKQWSDTGVLICNAVNNQSWPKVITDGSGGAIVVWQDDRTSFGNNDIYAQRINSTGTTLWAENGVPVFDNILDDLGTEVISDGNGGAIIVDWRSDISGNVSDIFAQRINGAGIRLWSLNGVIICNAINRQEVPKIISDGNNGAIIAWDDFRNSASNNVSDIYAQRITASGNVLWQNNGKSVCSMPYDQFEFQICGDNNNGAYFTWVDFRNSTPLLNKTDIYAQHFDGNGLELWPINGIPVCSIPSNVNNPSMITDNNNGVIICWQDTRLNTISIFAQRLSASGTPYWTKNGIPVCGNPGQNSIPLYPFQVADNNNGFYVFWQDKRNNLDKNIYAQHINSNGNPIWTLDGVTVCNAVGDQNLEYPLNQVADGAAISDYQGNAIVVWSDNRNQNGFNDIYISKVADSPAAQPIVTGIKQLCSNNQFAKGKLLNPPVIASIIIGQDGIPLVYSPIDSSFIYFNSSNINIGLHNVNIKYSNFAGFTQKDSSYSVSASLDPTIKITGNVVIGQGQSTILTADITNGGNYPKFQWQESINIGTWQDISGAISSSIVYNAHQTGDKIRCIFTSSANCISTSSAISNVLSFLVNSGGSLSSNNHSIRVYPNPVNKILFIDSLKLIDNWQSADLFSIDGKHLIFSKNINNQIKVSLDIGRFPSGLYLLVLKREDGIMDHFKLIKI